MQDLAFNLQDLVSAFSLGYTHYLACYLESTSSCRQIINTARYCTYFIWYSILQLRATTYIFMQAGLASNLARYLPQMQEFLGKVESIPLQELANSCVILSYKRWGILHYIPNKFARPCKFHVSRNSGISCIVLSSANLSAGKVNCPRANAQIVSCHRYPVTFHSIVEQFTLFYIYIYLDSFSSLPSFLSPRSR